MVDGEGEEQLEKLLMKFLRPVDNDQFENKQQTDTTGHVVVFQCSNALIDCNVELKFMPYERLY